MADARALTLAVAGALVMGYAVAALFFAKFWRRTRVALFGWFAVAFALLAAQRAMLVLAAPATPTAPGAAGAVPWSYVVRLLAFVLLLVGIVTQNRAPRRRR